MKKIWTKTLAMALVAMLSMSLASCDWDDDDYIAYTLEGTWQGNMYMSSEWDGRTYDATSSEICFLRDPYYYSSGSGYWVDYYRNAPWGRDYVANHIDWTVRNGVIEVYFREEGATLWIEHYSLTDNYFSGTIYDGESRVDFRLRHVDSPNWNNYYYGWDYYDDYYYAKPNGLEADTEVATQAVGKRTLRTK